MVGLNNLSVIDNAMLTILVTMIYDSICTLEVVHRVVDEVNKLYRVSNIVMIVWCGSLHMMILVKYSMIGITDSSVFYGMWACSIAQNFHL